MKWMLTLLLCLFGVSASAEGGPLVIRITQGVAGALPIAIVPFEPKIRYLFRAMRPRYRKPSLLADAFLDAVKSHIRTRGWA